MNDQYQIVKKYLGSAGRMISASKGGYQHENPEHLVIFNANLCTKEGKIWYGDIDVTLQGETLRALSLELNTTLYILREMDARFENEGAPLLDRAMVIVSNDLLKLGTQAAADQYYVEKKTGKIKYNLKMAKDLAKKAEAYRKKQPIDAVLSDYTLVLKLPKFSEFAFEKSEKTSPLEQFWLWIRTELELGNSKIDVTKVWLTQKDYDALKRVNTKWAAHKIPNDYQLQKAVNWLFFDIGPSCFGEGILPKEFAKSGKVYIKDDISGEK